MKQLVSIIVVWVVSTLFVTSVHAGGHKSKHSAPTKDIVEVAASAGMFNTLVTAAKAAGLVDALKGDGPLTVFAPTDEAFAALPEGTLASLLRPENKDQLKSILLYHVVSGSVMAEDVPKKGAVASLQGENIALRSDASGVRINQANVVKADVRASNGVIHVIDQVILPPTS
ncbi:MAG: fasciclin domain-containing protein [Pseudomonadota bacterium]